MIARMLLPARPIRAVGEASADSAAALDRRRGNAPIRCLVIHHGTSGLRQDVQMLSRAIHKSFPEADLRSWELPGSVRLHADVERMQRIPDAIKALLPFDIVFFLERMRPIRRVWEKGFARRIVFIPNIEWITDDDETVLQNAPLHAVLFKNQFSLDLARTIPAFGKVPLMRRVGWSSADITESEDRPEQSFDRFLHVRGTSRLKQTDVVLGAWWSNPDFPMIDILCRVSGELEFPAPAAIGGNIRVHVGKVANPDLRRMQRRIGIHVLPSVAEGFGHALNEARAASSVLVTTDGPPMNDFVEDGVSGFLVKVRSENIRPFNRSRAYHVTQEDLGEAVRRILTHRPDELHAMGQRARAAFLQDRDRFHADFGMFLKEIL
jgi:glycosyltransferase involved in cell wall biosynthesis